MKNSTKRSNRLWFRLALLTAVLLALPALLAAATKLYLKDGTFHLVSEYKVDTDRVRFYSVERSEWEELPLELIDLKKTEAEAQARKESEKESAKALDEEDKAEESQRREVEQIPQEAGTYYIDGGKLVTIKVGESEFVNSKKRTILRAVSPVPIMTGKGWVEMKGEHSPNVVKSATPEFYIRLSQLERFGILKMSAGKGGVRIVEKVTTVPGTEAADEQAVMVDIFRLQADSDVYKIWPMKPLEPGEYAVVEYTEGTMNMQVWDFSWPGGAKKAP